MRIFFKEFTDCIRARIFVQLLDAMCSNMLRKEELLGIDSEFKNLLASYWLTRVYRKLVPVCKYDSTYIAMLKARVSGLTRLGPTPRVQVSRLLQPSEIWGPRANKTEADIAATYEYIFRQLPGTLLSRPACKIKCWTCGIHATTTQICGGCRVARYCGLECMKNDWINQHKSECGALQKLPSGLRRNFEHAWTDWRFGLTATYDEVIRAFLTKAELVPSLSCGNDRYRQFVYCLKGHSAVPKATRSLMSDESPTCHALLHIKVIFVVVKLQPS